MEIINVIEAKKLIEQNLHKEDFELIDVRSPLEYKQAHIKGSKLIPLEELDKYIKEFNSKKTYLLYCRTGGRSGFAQKIFANNNLKAINMMGGIVDWIEEGYPIEK